MVRERVLDLREHPFAVIWMKMFLERRERPAEGPELETVDALDIRRPDHAASGQLPFPRAEATGFDRKPEARSDLFELPRSCFERAPRLYLLGHIDPVRHQAVDGSRLVEQRLIDVVEEPDLRSSRRLHRDRQFARPLRFRRLVGEVHQLDRALVRLCERVAHFPADDFDIPDQLAISLVDRVDDVMGTTRDADRRGCLSQHFTELPVSEFCTRESNLLSRSRCQRRGWCVRSGYTLRHAGINSPLEANPVPPR